MEALHVNLVVSKGLRQGDPLAPFLFNIVVEGLTDLMRETIKKKIFTSFKVGDDKTQVKLLYADDTLFIGETSLSNVVAIKGMLRCFELVSSLRVNLFKSNFGAIWIERDMMIKFANILNYKLLVFPFVYLGIPIGANPRLEATWKPVLDKFAKKLSFWKKKVLSFAGRVYVKNYVLSSLPLFYLSFFKFPIKVNKRIITTQRNFLWGGGEGQKKIMWKTK